MHYIIFSVRVRRHHGHPYHDGPDLDARYPPVRLFVVHVRPHLPDEHHPQLGRTLHLHPARNLHVDLLHRHDMGH